MTVDVEQVALDHVAPAADGVGADPLAERDGTLRVRIVPDGGVACRVARPQFGDDPPECVIGVAPSAARRVGDGPHLAGSGIPFAGRHVAPRIGHPDRREAPGVEFNFKGGAAGVPDAASADRRRSSPTVRTVPTR